MRSTVLPWYPGGHVLSKMRGRHLYLQDRHGEGSQMKKHREKHHEDCNPIKECGKKTGAEGELQELKNQAQPTHATAHSLTQRPKCHHHQEVSSREW